MALLPFVANICKKFGARSGLLQNARPDLNQYLLDILIDFMKKKVNIENKSADGKQQSKIPSMKNAQF